MGGFNLITFTLAAIILFIFYKKVIVPFSKKMLELKTEDELELDDEGSIFDDEDFFIEDNEANLREKINRLKGRLESRHDNSEDKLRYNILLEKLKEIATDNTESISSVLTELTVDEQSEEKKIKD